MNSESGLSSFIQTIAVYRGCTPVPLYGAASRCAQVDANLQLFKKQKGTPTHPYVDSFFFRLKELLDRIQRLYEPNWHSETAFYVTFDPFLALRQVFAGAGP